MRENDGIRIAYRGTIQRAINKMSEQNYYYNIDILGTKKEWRSKYVSETYWTTERVQVSKTRSVQKYVPVTKTRQVYDSFTKTWTTEFYTDYEWQTQMETYWDLEDRSMLKTRWVWKDVSVTIVDIPEYDIYLSQLDDGNKIAVYKIEEDGQTACYFQNVSYLTSRETEESIWGSKEIKLIFIDTDSNGIFFEDNDAMLFNTWNPYAEDSKYQNITAFMDNYRYRMSDSEKEAFLTFNTPDDYHSLVIRNANTAYIDTDKTGTINIDNVDPSMTILINGKEYPMAKS